MPSGGAWRRGVRRIGGKMLTPTNPPSQADSNGWMARVVFDLLGFTPCNRLSTLLRRSYLNVPSAFGLLHSFKRKNLVSNRSPSSILYPIKINFRVLVVFADD